MHNLHPPHPLPGRDCDDHRQTFLALTATGHNKSIFVQSRKVERQLLVYNIDDIEADPWERIKNAPKLKLSPKQLFKEIGAVKNETVTIP